MNMGTPLKPVTQEQVAASRDSLPAFPRVIEDVLITLDDPDANLNLLVSHVARDPVLAGRIFSQANVAATRTRRDSAVRDLYTATSLIGLARLRQTTIMTSLAGFLKGALPAGLSPGFWEHSSAAGVCAQQVAAYAHQPTDAALIAGLMHDVGQLWMCRFEPETFSAAWRAAATRKMTIVAAEQEFFGVDHTIIGAWLAETWGLPHPIVEAIRRHHAPDAALSEPLVPVVHVAEVLSNALEVSDRGGARVSYISAECCKLLGLTWDDSTNALFGRIDAVSQYVATYFKSPDGEENAG
jgi:putative nucleotidyltransferase with HDIG domain